MKKEHKCPNCGNRMVYFDGYLLCEYCGDRLITQVRK